MRKRTGLALGVALAVVVAAVGFYFFRRTVLDVAHRAARTKAEDNLRALAQYHVFAAYGKSRPWPPFTGKRRVLFPLASNQIDARQEQNLWIFFSPGDDSRSVARAGGVKAFSEITLPKLQDPAADFDRFTSYAGFGGGAPGETGAVPGSQTPILADLSFGDFAIVAFADGHVRTLTRTDLGLSPTDPLIAGPTSKSEILRRLSDK